MILREPDDTQWLRWSYPWEFPVLELILACISLFGLWALWT